MTALPVPMTQPPRIDALDGIRGVAILMVVGMHALRVPAGAVMPPGAGAPGTIDAFLTPLFGYGWAGVDLFFVLSGYLITGILLRSRDDPHYFRNFYMRRVLRIMPLYYAVVLTRLYVFPGQSYEPLEQVSLLTFWSNIWYALEPGSLLDCDAVTNVTWSVAIEEQFYLVWPLLVLATSRRALQGICVAIWIGALALRFVWGLRGEWQFVYQFTVFRIDTLAMGALLAMVGAQRVRRPGLALGASALLLAVAVWPHGAAGYDLWMQTAGYSLHTVVAAALIVLAQRGGLWALLFECRVLRAFGRYSYAIYLLQFPVIFGLERLLLSRNAPLSLRPLAEATGCYAPATLVFELAAAAACLLAGFVSWHVLEKHCLALRHHFVPRRRPAG